MLHLPGALPPIYDAKDALVLLRRLTFKMCPNQARFRLTRICVIKLMLFRGNFGQFVAHLQGQQRVGGTAEGDEVPAVGVE